MTRAARSRVGGHDSALSLLPQLASADLDFRGHRSVHRAALSNLQEPLPLGRIQISAEADLGVDLVKQPLFRLTVLAVLGVNPPVIQMNFNPVKGPTFVPRIHAESHGSSRAECREQQLVRTRPLVSAPHRLWLISLKFVIPRLDLLSKARTGHGTNHYFCSHETLPFSRARALLVAARHDAAVHVPDRARHPACLVRK